MFSRTSSKSNFRVARKIFLRLQHSRKCNFHKLSKSKLRLIFHWIPTFWIPLLERLLFILIYHEETKLRNSAFGTLNILQFLLVSLSLCDYENSFFELGLCSTLINKYNQYKQFSADRHRETNFSFFVVWQIISIKIASNSLRTITSTRIACSYYLY